MLDTLIHSLCPVPYPISLACLCLCLLPCPCVDHVLVSANNDVICLYPFFLFFFRVIVLRTFSICPARSFLPPTCSFSPSLLGASIFWPAVFVARSSCDWVVIFRLVQFILAKWQPQTGSRQQAAQRLIYYADYFSPLAPPPSSSSSTTHSPLISPMLLGHCSMADKRKIKGKRNESRPSRGRRRRSNNTKRRAKNRKKY